MVELRDEGWGMRAKRGGMREKGLGILVNDKEKWWGMRDKVEGMYDEEWWMCEEKWGVRDKIGEIINEDWRIRGEGWGEVSEELLSEEVWRTYCTVYNVHSRAHTEYAKYSTAFFGRFCNMYNLKTNYIYFLFRFVKFEGNLPQFSISCFAKFLFVKLEENLVTCKTNNFGIF